MFVHRCRPTPRKRAAIGLVGLLLFVSCLSPAAGRAAPAQQTQPDPCLDARTLQAYLGQAIPPEVWQDMRFVKAVDLELHSELPQALAAYQAVLQAEPGAAYADLIQLTIGDVYTQMKDHLRSGRANRLRPGDLQPEYVDEQRVLKQ
jgi:hypothetical protein